MKRISQYQIVEATMSCNLELFVNREIKEGWQPLGNCTIARTNENRPAVSSDEDLFVYYQTMVLYEDY